MQSLTTHIQFRRKLELYNFCHTCTAQQLAGWPQQPNTDHSTGSGWLGSKYQLTNFHRLTLLMWVKNLRKQKYNQNSNSTVYLHTVLKVILRREITSSTSEHNVRCKKKKTHALGCWPTRHSGCTVYFAHVCLLFTHHSSKNCSEEHLPNLKPQVYTDKKNVPLSICFNHTDNFPSSAYTTGPLEMAQS